MSKSIFSLVVALLVSVAAYSQYWQQQVNYTIDVTLNDKEHSLDGFEKIIYTNNSHDTIGFIWFHLWPNAFKNDKTAFSEQLLINDRTDFYFSNKEQRGYINRLDFKVDGITAQINDHPQYIDIIKLVLPKPLAPGARVAINTPFHVQLPENFSRGGHNGDAYQVTQWFPKPAVYDSKGWHPIPYLNQGEFYSEFGNFDVRITVPANYVVAATGELQNDEEKEWLKKRALFTWESITSKTIVKKGSYKHVKKTVQLYPASAANTKTIQFVQNNVHDFAWFADKRFVVKQDTLQLASGKIVTAYSYYLPGTATQWKNSVDYIKKAIRFRSAAMGEYPYHTVSAVEAKMGFEGGMEYPTITSISPTSSADELENLIEHEVGHNWLQGILATNERQYPWMDEGMNTYYDNRYKQEQKRTVVAETKNQSFRTRIIDNIEPLLLQSLIAAKKDQPINTPADNFTELNNALVAYYKTGEWMKLLENYLGKPVFDSCMKTYYKSWQFKHPYPEDFKTIITQVSAKNTDTIFNLLQQKGALPPLVKRKIQPAAGLLHIANTARYNYINVFPAAGFNQYDKFMIGLLLHNYNLPAERLQFLLAPLYATGSKTFNGLGRISYTSYPSPAIYKVVYSLSAEKFSTNARLDTFNNKVFENFSKIVPGVRVYFNHPLLSKITSSVDLRGFFITEKADDDYVHKSGDTVNNYPVSSIKTSRWLAQLSYNYTNNRALYPYQYQVQWQQGEHFYRLNLTGNYFFNYAKSGGLNVRAFAAKFGYIGGRSADAFIYQPKLLGVRGGEDYTYSNYFIGRSASIANGDGPIANKGLGAQQIMIRDGGLKLVLDLYDHLQGRSENWVSALNFTSTLPGSIFPEKFPLKLFLDIGTYAEAWKNDPPTSRFLYTAGLQLSLLKNVLNVYMPLFYSSDFKNELKSTYPANRLLKSISFSIDIQNFNLGKINKHLDF